MMFCPNMNRLFAVYLVLVFPLPICGYPLADDVRRLKEDIFKNTDPLVRPVLNDSDKITVNVSIILFVLLDLNVAAQTMTFQIGVGMHWMDEAHSWNAELYGNVSEIKTTEIWTPPMIIGNNIQAPFTLEDIGYFPSIQQNGQVFYLRGKTTQTTCNADVSKFPMDSQTCTIVVLNSDGRDVKLQIESLVDYSKVANGIIETRGEWEIMRSEAKLDDTRKNVAGEEYLIVTINMRRRYLFYLFTLIFPCILISFGSQCVFLIPTNCGEKISYSVSIMLSFSIYFNAINSFIPKTSDPVSHLLVYMILSYICSVLSTAGVIVIEWCHNTESRKRAVPRYLWKMVVRGQRNIESAKIFATKLSDEKVPASNNNSNQGTHVVERNFHDEYTLENIKLEWEKFAFELNCLWFKMTCSMTIITTGYLIIALAV